MNDTLEATPNDYVSIRVTVVHVHRYPIIGLVDREELNRSTLIADTVQDVVKAYDEVKAVLHKYGVSLPKKEKTKYDAR